MQKILVSRYLWFAIILLFLISAYFWAPEPLDLKTIGVSELLPFLGTLLLIALFAERTLEVFLTTWRGPIASIKDQEIESKDNEIVDLKSMKPQDKKAITRSQKELNVLKKDREEYRMGTRRWALWAGLLIGLVISSFGIRALNELIIDQPEGLQEVLFKILDIVLTGCIIAGGSDGIHKIAEVYLSFMGTTSKLAHDRGKKK